MYILENVEKIKEGLQKAAENCGAGDKVMMIKDKRQEKQPSKVISPAVL